MDKPRKYLFATQTNFNNGKLTGAHRRFLELLSYIAEENDVVFVGIPNEQIKGMPRVKVYEIDYNTNGLLPKHLAEGHSIYKTLRKFKKCIDIDYAVAFSPITTIAYHLAGVKHIVSLFREDLIGYYKALQSSAGKIAYFQFQERLAVSMSEKVIVQCVNDRNNLIARNEKHCKHLRDKVYIQINNANASWMRCNYSRIVNNVNPIPTVLFIGNFADPRKGHGILLPAAKRLREEGYLFKLLIAGDGIELDKYKSEYESDSAFQFLGRVTNMSQYLEMADFVIVPSLIDSCLNTVLEGLNAGVAVYGANTGGIPDLLSEKEYLFEPSVEDVYFFLKKIIDEKRYLSDAKRQALRKESLTFNWGKAIEQIIIDHNE